MELFYKKNEKDWVLIKCILYLCSVVQVVAIKARLTVSWSLDRNKASANQRSVCGVVTKEKSVEDITLHYVTQVCLWVGQFFKFSKKEKLHAAEQTAWVLTGRLCVSESKEKENKKKLAERQRDRRASGKSYFKKTTRRGVVICSALFLSILLNGCISHKESPLFIHGDNQKFTPPLNYGRFLLYIPDTSIVTLMVVDTVYIAKPFPPSKTAFPIQNVGDY